MFSRPFPPNAALPLALLVCWLGLVVCAAAQQQQPPAMAFPPPEYDLAQISGRLDALEYENQQLRNLIAAKKPDSVTTSGWPIKFRGRVHVDYWAFPGDSPGVNAFENGDATTSPQDRLEIRRARFEASGGLPGNMSYDLDFELSEASDPEFRDMFIEWHDLPVLQTLRFGNQKRPYGMDHLNSSNFNVFLERPLVVQAFNRNNRRFGLVSYGVSPGLGWNWRYGVYNLRELQTDGVYVSDHYQLEMAARLARTISDQCDESRYLHLAISANYAEPDGDPKPGREVNQARFRTEPEARTQSQWLDTGTIDGADRFGILGLETAFNFRRIQIAGEYMNLWLDRSAAFGESLHFHGGYLQAACFLTSHHQPWIRRRGILGRVRTLDNRPWSPAWQLAIRWSFADLSSSDVRGGVGEGLTTALNWYWIPRARLQFHCNYGQITDHAPVDGQTEGDFVSLGTRVMVDF